MNIPLYSSSIDKIIRLFKDKSLNQIINLPNINPIDKLKLQHLVNYQVIIPTIEHNNQCFYIRKLDKDEYIKVCFITSSILEENTKYFTELQKISKDYVETLNNKMSLLKNTDFDGENLNALANTNKELEEWRESFLNYQREKNAAIESIMKEWNELNSNNVSLKKTNDDLYEEIKEIQNEKKESRLTPEDAATQAASGQFVIFGINLEKQKELYLEKKYEYDSKRQNLLAEKETIMDGEVTYVEKNNQLKEFKSSITSKQKQLDSLKEYRETKKANGVKYQETYKSRKAKYETLFNSLSEEEKISRKDELDSFLNDKIKPLKVILDEYAVWLKNDKEGINKLQSKIDSELEKYKTESRINEKFRDDLREIEQKIENLDKENEVLNQLSEIFEINDEYFMKKLLKLKSETEEELFQPFDVYIKKMSSSVLEEEKAKFKAQKKQLKAEYATISEELREQKKSIAERRSLLEENKAKLKSRRQKLTEVLVSSSVLNPPSEEVREKNNITIKNYESKTQELVNYIEEEEREVIPIENDILEKSNDIEKKKNILLKVSEIFKKNKKYIMKLIKKFKKNFSVVSNDNIVELLQSIEQNRAVIYENLKKMGVIEKKLNLHTSGIYVYNLNNVSLENVSRNDILDTLIEISTKTKTRKAADVLLNKRLEKLKLVGGFISNASKGYTYDLEYIEDDSNGTYSINTYYSRMKKELKKNKVN